MLVGHCIGLFSSFYREKLVAKMKLKPGDPLSPGVETEDQLWSILKKYVV